MPENVIYKAAQRSRPVCANCKYAILFQEPYDFGGRIAYGICIKKDRDISMLWSACPKHAPSERRAPSPEQTVALLLHTLKQWDGWGETRRKRLITRAAETLQEMQGSELIRPFTFADLEKEYEEEIKPLRSR